MPRTTQFFSKLTLALFLALAFSLASPAAVPVDMDGLVEAAWIDDDRQFMAGDHLPHEKIEITTRSDASGAVDGVKDSPFGFHTAQDEFAPWWQVDLGGVHDLDRVVVYNRTDNDLAYRTREIQVWIQETPEQKLFRKVYQHDGTLFYGAAENAPLVVHFEEAMAARIVRLAVPGNVNFALVEVEVYAKDGSEHNIALGKPADQKSISPWSYPGTKGYGPGGASAFEAFSLDHTAAVLARAERLAARLSNKHHDSQLAALSQRLSANASPETRRALYFEARALLRRIAFTNPLLADIDRLLFIKRHDPAGVFHMVDQYYGFNAVCGGGLYVLEGPFSETPRLRDVLADSVVVSGRLAGRPLTPGSFISPDISYDGQTIFFAYTQGEGTPGSPEYTPAPEAHWTPESSYHLFRVNSDGTGLRQLTDGHWNDFDPCVLPNGRIAFISERRGGFLRCGRYCPTFTLFSMEPDGSDIVWLSMHETHEWNPSVDQDGMLLFTRWDYVDRDANIAHHLWTSYPDGSDPRAPHGNYPSGPFQDRPFMELRIRAIPGSHRYVGVAAAHHGHEFGSLILIDTRLEDDGAMSQLTRLTPEVPFPESEACPTETMIYGTPWPLSEDDYLVVYDGNRGKNRGIYWMDRDGNRELVYRDPEISCISPMPLRPRKRPPVIPSRTVQAARDVAAAGGKVPSATISVMNVYESNFEWPEGTRIHALRIIQALPKTTPAPNEPRIGVADQSNARTVLGTAPVEADGSAYFEAPVGKAIYFQALDEQGMAVQSMRSATFVHPGEHLSCRGCHEPRLTSPAMAATDVPLALRRPPSPITPEPEGSNPFSFVRLVQPVLDKHCVGCHEEKEQAPDLCGTIEGPHGFSRAYNTLARAFGFYYDVSNSVTYDPRRSARSTAGRFGAREARLMRHLEDHKDVTLSEEDRRRLIVWLDANSEFFGAYDDTEAQSRGEIVYATMH